MNTIPRIIGNTILEFRLKLFNQVPSVVRFISGYLITLLLLVISYTLSGQDARVLVENAKISTAQHPVVLIKWYTENLLYPEGVNLYRKEENTLTWAKLNATPIKKKTMMAPSLLSKDPDMEPFVKMIQSATAKDLQVSIVQFNLLLKSFQSNDFADFMGIYFEDGSVVSDKKYAYKVGRIKNGSEFPIGVSPVITAGTYQPGNPVKDVVAVQKQKKINLNWAQEEERFYAVNVYRKLTTDSSALRLNKNPLMLSQIIDSLGRKVYPNPMFAEDLKLEEGKVYTYQVAGVGFFGNETRWSDPVEVAFKDITPPKSPKSLTGKADSMRVHLHWKIESLEEPITVNIHRSNRSDGLYKHINKAPLNAAFMQYLDSITIAGPYYYFVSAVDAAGNEAHSDLIFVEVQDVIPPLQPLDLTIKTDTGKVNLSWKMNAETDLAGYYLYRTVNKDKKKNYILLNAEPLKSDRFSENLPKNVRNTFFYYIVAVDTSFNRSRPSAFVSAAMPDILAPEKPFIKNVSYEEDHILVEWISNVDSDLAGYHLYRSDTSRKFSRLNVNLLGKSTFRYTDRENEPNANYFYCLVAMDSAGNTSPKSNEMYARRISVDAVSISSKLNVRIKSLKKKKNVQVTWQHEVGGSDLLGFVIYRGDQENRLQPVTGLIKTNKYTDKLSSGESKNQWYYQVRAYQSNSVIYSSVIKLK